VAGLTERDKIPQASLLPLSINVADTVAEPVTPRYTVCPVRHKAVGGVTSCIVTTEAQEVVLPLPSVATTVTLLLPRLAQEKTRVVWLFIVSVTALQLSNPVANEVADTVTLPNELSCAVKG
jgi:hypothetical protein